jgi:hypothetical protein
MGYHQKKPEIAMTREIRIFLNSENGEREPGPVLRIFALRPGKKERPDVTVATTTGEVLLP